MTSKRNKIWKGFTTWKRREGQRKVVWMEENIDRRQEDDKKLKVVETIEDQRLSRKRRTGVSRVVHERESSDSHHENRKSLCLSHTIEENLITSPPPTMTTPRRTGRCFLTTLHTVRIHTCRSLDRHDFTHSIELLPLHIHLRCALFSSDCLLKDSNRKSLS